MVGIIPQIGDGFTGISVGIDKSENFVRYLPYVVWRVYAGIINNEDLAVHILKHESLATNHTKDEDGIQQARFASPLVRNDSQMPIMVLIDAWLTCKDGASSYALQVFPLIKDVYHTTPLVPEEHQ